MTRTLVGISHKGGTGRSVTLANVAFHLARRGWDVCLVDLDLTSPTMGAVLGMKGYEMGAEPGSAHKPRSIYDLLYHQHEALTAVNSIDYALVDIWSASPSLRAAAPVNRPNLRLLPGRANINLGQLEFARLTEILSALNSRFDAVLLDVRSGNSEVASALTDPAVDAEVWGWILHYRWTHQHLAGVRNFAESFFGDGEGRFTNRVKMIRTAVPAIGGTGTRRAWVKQYDQSLQSLLLDLPPELQQGAIGAIPFDSMLLWNETVLTEKMVDGDLADRATYEAFAQVAAKAATMLESVDA